MATRTRATPVIRVESTLTQKYQTTVPEVVRQFLHLSKQDKIVYEIRGEEVVIHRGSIAPPDPAIGAFLDFLQRDIHARPNAVSPITPALRDRMLTLVQDIPVDLDASLDPADD